jgi:hypothetical protein
MTNAVALGITFPTHELWAHVQTWVSTILLLLLSHSFLVLRGSFAIMRKLLDSETTGFDLDLALSSLALTLLSFHFLPVMCQQPLIHSRCLLNKIGTWHLCTLCAFPGEKIQIELTSLCRSCFHKTFSWANFIYKHTHIFIIFMKMSRCEGKW